MAYRMMFMAGVLALSATSVTALVAGKSAEAAAFRAAMQDMRNAAKNFGESIAWEMADLPDSQELPSGIASKLLLDYANRLEHGADNLKAQLESDRMKVRASTEGADRKGGASRELRASLEDPEEDADDLKLKEELEANVKDQEQTLEKYDLLRKDVLKELGALDEQEAAIQKKRQELENKLSDIASDVDKASVRAKEQAQTLRRLAGVDALEDIVPQVVRTPLDASAASDVMENLRPPATEDDSEHFSSLSESTIIESDGQGNTVKRTTRCEGGLCTETIESSPSNLVKGSPSKLEESLPVFPLPSIDDAIRSLADVVQSSSDRLSESTLGDLLDGAFSGNFGGMQVVEPQDEEPAVLVMSAEPADDEVVLEDSAPPAQEGEDEADAPVGEAEADVAGSAGTSTEVQVTFSDGKMLRKTRKCIKGEALCTIEVQEEPVSNLWKQWKGLWDQGVKKFKEFKKSRSEIEERDD